MAAVVRQIGPIKCDSSLIAEQQTILFADGGAIPTLSLLIRQIDHKTAKTLVENYHYLGKTKFLNSVRFGLYENGTLIGAAIFGGLSAPESAVSAFGLPRGNYPNLLELHRFVIAPSHNNNANSGSYLLGGALRQLKKMRYRAVISYADATHHVGYLYQATNFTYHGLATAKKDFYIDGVKQSRGPTKGKNGVWQDRPKKHRYIYVLDKTLTISWPILPYPKLK